MNPEKLTIEQRFAFTMFVVHAVLCLVLFMDRWFQLPLLLLSFGTVFPFAKGGDFQRLVAWWRRSRKVN